MLIGGLAVEGHRRLVCVGAVDEEREGECVSWGTLELLRRRRNRKESGNLRGFLRVLLRRRGSFWGSGLIQWLGGWLLQGWRRADTN